MLETSHVIGKTKLLWGRDCAGRSSALMTSYRRPKQMCPLTICLNEMEISKLQTVSLKEQQITCALGSIYLGTVE